jgi:hypothetical protein
MKATNKKTKKGTDEGKEQETGLGKWEKMKVNMRKQESMQKESEEHCEQG